MKKYSLENYNGIHYMKIEMESNELEIRKKFVIFSPTSDLINYIHKNPNSHYQMYSFMLPKDFTYYILSYENQIHKVQTIVELAERYKDFIKEKVGKCYLAGISYGGPVAISFASLYPQLVDKLYCLISAHRSNHDFVQNVIDYASSKEYYKVAETIDDLFNSRIFRFITGIQRRLNKNKMEKKNNPIEDIEHGYRLWLDSEEKTTELAKKIIVPTYIFGGKMDKAFPTDAYKELNQLIPNSKLYLFENAGHLLPVEKKKEFYPKFLETLKK